LDLRRLAELGVVGQAQDGIVARDPVDPGADEPHHVVELGVDGKGADAGRRTLEGRAEGEIVVGVRPLGVVLPAAARSVRRWEGTRIVLERHAALSERALALRIGGGVERARLKAAGEAEPPPVVERDLRAGGEQACGLVESDLIERRAAVEEAGIGAGPQTLAFADDRGGVGAADLGSGESC